MSKPTNTNDTGVMIDGYDPVAYFSGTPAKGDASISATVDGRIYHFASEGNRDLFTADPGKFEPQYGGYCATAMSEGKIFEVDPTNFKVTDDRLFLFYKGEAGDTLPEWNADEDNRRHAADAHWQNDTYAEHD